MCLWYYLDDNGHNGDLYGIDSHRGTYKVVEKEVGMPNTFVINSAKAVDNDNLIAIGAIFVVIVILTGIICFVMGGGLAGVIGYNRGRQSGQKKKGKDDQLYERV